MRKVMLVCHVFLLLNLIAYAFFYSAAILLGPFLAILSVAFRWIPDEPKYLVMPVVSVLVAILIGAIRVDEIGLRGTVILGTAISMGVGSIVAICAGYYRAMKVGYVLEVISGMVVALLLPHGVLGS